MKNYHFVRKAHLDTSTLHLSSDGMLISGRIWQSRLTYYRFHQQIKENPQNANDDGSGISVFEFSPNDSELRRLGGIKRENWNQNSALRLSNCFL